MKKHNLGNYLKKKRIEADFTQAQVAKKLGYSSPQFVSNFERNLCSPPLKQMKKIVAMYGIEPSELIGIMMEERLKLLEKTFYGRSRKKSS